MSYNDLFDYVPLEIKIRRAMLLILRSSFIDGYDIYNLRKKGKLNLCVDCVASAIRNEFRE